jgi:DNA gyrase subunit A
VLFFSSIGIVYKLKVYLLPPGTPQTRGKAMINILPLKEGETISTLMPLPEDETAWKEMFVMFATASGGVRRNRLSDFVNVKANGKIAMKLDDGDCLVDVLSCSEDHDVLLAARSGKCIRFPVTDVRVFRGRDSTGVRGIRLGKEDKIISMSILSHVEADAATRDDFLQAVSATRRLSSADYTDKKEDRERDEAVSASLNEPAFEAMARDEEFILTVTENGFGKRTSAYEYRIAGRGGQGIANIETSERNGNVVASFWVDHDDQIVMVSDGGQIIRCPVADIRIAGRRTQGVTLFTLAEDERMVSVTRLVDVGNDDDGSDEFEEPEEGAVTATNTDEIAKP